MEGHFFIFAQRHGLYINVVAHFTGQWTPMTLTTKYLTFWTRVRKEFLAGFLIVTAIILYNYVKEGNEFGVFGLMILGFGLVYMLVALFNARTFVSEVRIADDKFIVTGHTFDARWNKEIDVKSSDIKIRSKGRGRGKVDYYLQISSPDRTVEINRSFNWDYFSLLTIFHEFKRIKGEKVVFDEKFFLDIMEKKANEFSTWDIASGKELRK